MDRCSTSVLVIKTFLCFWNYIQISTTVDRTYTCRDPVIGEGGLDLPGYGF